MLTVTVLGKQLIRNFYIQQVCYSRKQKEGAVWSSNVSWKETALGLMLWWCENNMEKTMLFFPPEFQFQANLTEIEQGVMLRRLPAGWPLLKLINVNHVVGVTVKWLTTCSLSRSATLREETQFHTIFKVLMYLLAYNRVFAWKETNRGT